MPETESLITWTDWEDKRMVERADVWSARSSSASQTNSSPMEKDGRTLFSEGVGIIINEKRLLDEFFQLTRITSTSGRERQLADYLQEKIRALGLPVREDEAGKRAGGTAGNLVVTLAPAGKESRPLLLCAHMDTVEPAQDVHPVLENGIVRSRGNTILGADDKAGIAVILEVLRIILENNMEHSGLEVVFTIWEEGGLLGAKNLDFSGLNARLGYVLDCDGPPGTIIVRAPSQDRIRAKIRGKTAHAGINPEEGVNAIYVAACAIARMKLGRVDGETTANIGVISGGKATNIVPDLVILEGEARSLAREKRLRQTQEMCRELSRTAEKLGARAEIETETLYEEFTLSKDSVVVQLALTAAQNLGFPPRLTGSGGGSDANIFNHQGITCANLGIGMQKVHTTEEYIKVTDLVNSARLLLEIVRLAREVERV